MKKYNKKKSKNSKYIYIIGFCLVVFAGLAYGAYYVINNINNKNTSNSNNDSSNDGTSGNNNYKYVRSPYGAKFKINDSNQSFVLSSSHFDSPGVSSSKNNSLNEKETTSSISGQGSQEVAEAQNIDKVLDNFKDYFQTNNIIFFADTNIKKGNQDKAFSSLTNSSYSMLFKDNETYSTSLSSTINSFANPYDKIIYSFENNGLSISDSSYDDIKSVIKPNYESKTGFAINTFLTLPSSVMTNGVEWIDYSNKYYSDAKNPVYNYVKYLASDHIPVGTNINYTNDSNVLSSIRVGGWNTLNFSLYNNDFSSYNVLENPTSSTTKKVVHEMNIAKIIYHAKYDLIALIEINKDTPQTNVNYFLNYLNSLDSNNSYNALLSNNTPAINQNSGQIEQVLFIYNNKKISLDDSIKPNFYNNYSSTNLNISNLFIKSLNIYIGYRGIKNPF